MGPLLFFNESVGGITFSQATDASGLFTGVGGAILALLTLAKPLPRPLMSEFHRLEASINQLHHQVSQHVRETEAIAAEHFFMKDIMHKVRVQERLLDNLLTTPTNKTAEQFMKECKLHPPQELLTSIIDSIRHGDFNSTRDQGIEKRWKQAHHLGEALAMINGVFNGLSKREDNETMAGSIRKLEAVLEDFENTHEIGAPKHRNRRYADYWSHVIRIVEGIMDRGHLSHDEKAILIRDELTPFTKTRGDQFYIIVYNDVSGHDHHSFRGIPDQTLYRFRRGGCNVVIYASTTAHTTSYADYDWLKGKVEAWRDGWIPANGHMDGYVDSVWNDIKWQGFVGLIRKDNYIAIRSTSPDWEWGPGWWISTKGKDSNRETLLIVGLK